MKINSRKIFDAIFSPFYVLFLLFLILFLDSGAGWYWQMVVQVFPGMDKVFHFLLFGGMTFAVQQTNAVHLSSVINVQARWISLALLLLVTGEECSQLFIACRKFEWLDVLANFSGVTTAHILWVRNYGKEDDRQDNYIQI